MSKESSANNSLIAAILIAAVLISGALVYAGMKLGGNQLSKDDVKTAIIEVFTGKTDDQQDQEQPEANTDDSYSNDELASDDPFEGAEDAPVVIVEFSDFQCPYCANFALETYPLIKEKYIDTGKVKFVFRDYPLSGHPAALPASIAADCVLAQKGNAEYFEMHNKIFADQQALSIDAESALSSMALSLGVDEEQYRECYLNEEYKTEALSDAEDGKGFGVTATPSFFINGRFMRGAQPMATFEQLIEAELAK